MSFRGDSTPPQTTQAKYPHITVPTQTRRVPWAESHCTGQTTPAKNGASDCSTKTAGGRDGNFRLQIVKNLAAEKSVNPSAAELIDSKQNATFLFVATSPAFLTNSRRGRPCLNSIQKQKNAVTPGDIIPSGNAHDVRSLYRCTVLGVVPGTVSGRQAGSSKRAAVASGSAESVDRTPR